LEFSNDSFINVRKIVQIIKIIRYAATFIPYKIAYVEDDAYPYWDILDNTIDSIFLLDLILTFFSAYYDDKNNLITDFNLIIKNYLKTWFLLDLVVSFFSI